MQGSVGKLRCCDYKDSQAEFRSAVHASLCTLPCEEPLARTAGRPLEVAAFSKSLMRYSLLYILADTAVFVPTSPPSPDSTSTQVSDLSWVALSPRTRISSCMRACPTTMHGVPCTMELPTRL